MNHIGKLGCWVAGLLCLAALTVWADEIRPFWVDNPSSRFSASDIYAVGNGPTLDKAKSNARGEVLKYFEVNIQTSFQGKLTATEQDSAHKIQDSVDENATGILKGINILQTYHDEKEGFYALAVLDKSKVAADLAQEIADMDNKMQVLLQDESTVGAPLETLYRNRENLNKKYLFLTGKSIAPKVSYKEVVDKINSAPKLHFYVSSSALQYAPDLAAQLAQAVTEKGYLVTQKQDQANRVLNLSATAQEEYMKVAGFVKYTLTFQVEDKQADKTLGTLSRSYTETGRTPEQAYRKAAAKFAAYMRENVENVLK